MNELLASSKVFGVEVVLDHYFFPADHLGVQLLVSGIGSALQEINEPFQIGKHRWFVDRNGVEVHFRWFKGENISEPLHPSRLPHVGFRTNTLKDLRQLKMRCQDAGISVIEPDVPRKYQDGVVERFYVEIDARVIEYLFHPGKVSKDD